MKELTKETWKEVKGFEGRYEVSDLGNVKSIISKNHKILKGAIQKNGYKTFQLRSEEGKSITKSGHALVAEAFIPNDENKPTVDHINEDKLDNRVSNLRWATYSEQRANISNIKSTRRKRFSEKTIRHIVSLRNTLKLSYDEIASLINCSPISILYIFQGKTYSSITGYSEAL